MLRVDDQAFRTDTGRQRSENEDALFVRAPIFVVADGMGGAQAGEVASKRPPMPSIATARSPREFLRETIGQPTVAFTSGAGAAPSRAGWHDDHRAIVDARKERSQRHAATARLPPARRGSRTTPRSLVVEEMRRKARSTMRRRRTPPTLDIIAPSVRHRGRGCGKSACGSWRRLRFAPMSHHDGR